MANDQNLKKFGSERDARESGRKGGIKSGENRRKKRAMKNAAKLLLDMPISHENISDQLRAMGFADEDLTNQMAVMVSVFKEAMSGNIRAAEFLRDTAGENVSENRDYSLRKRDADRRDAEFEYKKQKEAGISYEIEDLDDIEGELYGEEDECQGNPESPST